MSILIVGAGRAVGGMRPLDLVTRLTSQGDEVRVLDVDRHAALLQELGTAGAHVARGEPTDADLIERAALNARTIVLLHWGNDRDAELEAVLEGARAARVDRVILVTEELEAATLASLEGQSASYIALRVPRPRALRRPRLQGEDIAMAVDAADDLAGEPRLQLDLADFASWGELLLEPPRN